MRFARLLLFVFSALLVAVPVAAREEIKSFHSHIIVRADGTLEITETIEVQVEGRQIKRGILRDFPTIYKNPDGTRATTSFDVQDVRLDGGAVNWRTERISNGVRLRIGSRDILLRAGVYTYSIHYLTSRQIYFGEDAEDQLYFNVTGNGWDFPILEASAVVVLPQGAGATRTTAFTGAEGSTEGAFAQFTNADGSPGFRTLRPLNPGEGLTIVVGWPAGFVTRPTAGDEAAFFLKDNITVFAAAGGLLLVFLYFLVAWHMAGRDPEGGAIIARYEPPKGFSPAAAHFVSNMGFSDTAFTAAIVDMAVKGYLTIKESSDGDLTLRFVGDKSKLTRGERSLGVKLFSALKGDVEVDAKNHERFSKAKKRLRSSLAEEYEAAHFMLNRDYLWGGVALVVLVFGAIALLSDRPQVTAFSMVWLAGVSVGAYVFAGRVKTSWTLALNSGASLKAAGYMITAIIATAVILPVAGMLAAGADQLLGEISMPVMLLIAGTMGTTLTFHHLLKAPTRLGRRVMDEIDGFREYLSVAEADRMQFHNPPEKTPELFEKYLPYAIALGVEHEWGEKFDDILAAVSTDQGQGGYHPHWYSGSHRYGSFRSSSFSSSMGAAFTGAISAASTAPSSGGGGFGGGGFSGGGGGGGGGGGW